MLEFDLHQKYLLLTILQQLQLQGEKCLVKFKTNEEQSTLSGLKRP